MVSKEQRIPMENEGKFKTWFKRIGVAGFMFFLIKGIIWILVFWLGKEAVFGWLS